MGCFTIDFFIYSCEKKSDETTNVSVRCGLSAAQLNLPAPPWPKRSRSTVNCPVWACGFDPVLPACLGVVVCTRVEGVGRLFQQPLLLTVNLIRVRLVTLRRVCNCRPLPQRLKRNPRLQRRVDFLSRLRRHLPLCLLPQSGLSFN